MPKGQYERPAANADALTRATEHKSVQIAPDKNEVRDYIKARMKEQGLSTYKFGAATGMNRSSFAIALMNDSAVSYETLGYLLYIVDGYDSPWRYRKPNELDERPTRTSEPNESGRMTPGEFAERHPFADVNEWDANEWIVTEGDRELRYEKKEFSMYESLYKADKELC